MSQKISAMTPATDLISVAVPIVQGGANKQISSLFGTGGITATRIPFAASAVAFGDSASFTWDNTNLALTVNGQRILAKGTNGAKGIYFGYGAGNTTTITHADGFNTGLGYNALNAITDAAGAGTFYDASYNAVFGYEAGLQITRGASNVLMGYRAGRGITTGLGNVGIGKDCLRLLSGASSSNTAVGYLTLDAMTGSENTAVGASALSGAGSGTRNVAMGYIALTAVTNGSNNVGVGSETFELITTQGNNTGVGFWSGVFNKGSNNVAIGAYAMGQATLNSTNDASYNTIVGPSAGSFIAVGDYNTWIGYNTGTAGTGEDYDNTIAIGKGAKVTESNSCVIGSKVSGDRVNYGFGGESYGGGRGVFFIADAHTVPTTDPTAGGILYTEGGALKYRGSAGTVTTVAIA